MNSEHKPFRVAITGGPGGGKTTAVDLFRRELGEKVVIVPETATMLYGGGFPRTSNTHARKAIQKTIFYVQKQLEEIQASLFPERILLCDRGTIDGSVYWPSTPDDFFEAVKTTKAHEFARYDAVLFFQSAAAAGETIEGGNPYRIESISEAAQLDQQLYDQWSTHPVFHLIKHESSFMGKINEGLRLLNEHCVAATK
jgi:predicted ATPase